MEDGLRWERRVLKLGVQEEPFLHVDSEAGALIVQEQHLRVRVPVVPVRRQFIYPQSREVIEVFLGHRDMLVLEEDVVDSGWVVAVDGALPDRHVEAGPSGSSLLQTRSVEA